MIQGGRVGRTPGGQFLMNVAALDDVVALLLLSAVLTIVGGRFDVIAITGGIAESVIAWVVLLVASVVIIPRVLHVPRLRDLRGMPFLILFVLVAVVVALGFSAVIGAFIAGLAIAESLAADRTRELTETLLLVFGALFFVVTGAQFDVHQLTNLVMVGLALVLAVVAAAGKVLGVYPFARLRLGRTPAVQSVVLGMIPRGEIGLIVGSIGLAVGVFDQTMLGEVLLMSLATTLVGTFLFRRVSGRLGPPEPSPNSSGALSPAPASHGQS
jgi:Kef-type K+ transport system membrane component KefB